jgi:hypothetical protein
MKELFLLLLKRADYQPGAAISLPQLRWRKSCGR